MEEHIISLDVSLDESGFLDRKCPNFDCDRYFKVLYSDWSETSSPTMVCPFCGFNQDGGSFNTPEQQDYFEEAAQAVMQERLQQMLGQLGRQMRSRQTSKSPIRIDVTTRFNRILIPFTPEANSSLRLEIVCEDCGSTFAVTGAGFFCPFCGKNSAERTFTQSLTKVMDSIEIASSLDDEIQDPGQIQNVRTSILENQIEDLATIFQRLGEALSEALPTGTKPPSRNLFQRLANASDYWEEATGERFESYLDEDEWVDFLKFMQQRHVLAHRDGFIDAEYIQKSGDKNYAVGQKLIVTEAQVRRMHSLVSKLGYSMADKAQGSNSTPNLREVRSDLPGTGKPLPGLTSGDWEAFTKICELAVTQDHYNFDREQLLLSRKDMEVTEEDLSDSLDILQSQGLLNLSHTLDGSPLPRHIAITRKALEIYFSRTMHNYRDSRTLIAQTLLDGSSNSDQIVEQTKLSRLFVIHVLWEFESRGWIHNIHWSAGVAYVHVKTSVHLKRL